MSKRFLYFLLMLAVAVVLTALLVYYISPSKIVLVLRAANIWFVLTFVPLVLLCMWLAALQLKILTDYHGMNIGLMQIISINSSAESYYLFLPGFISGGLYGVAPTDAFVLSLLTFVRNLFQATIGFVIKIKTLFNTDNT